MEHAARVVFVARPSGRTASIVARVRALGHVAHALPTARFEPAADAAQARAALRRGRDDHAVIFTSPTAVAYAARLDPGALARIPRAIAVGAATARALRRRGLVPLVPVRYDSEGVLALAPLHDVRGRRVTLVTAPGGRNLLADALAQRGADVARADVYRRALPQWSARHHHALAAADGSHALVLSSVEALAALRQLATAQAYERLVGSGIVVAPGERVATALHAAGARRVIVAASAMPEALVGALARAAW